MYFEYYNILVFAGFRVIRGCDTTLSNGSHSTTGHSAIHRKTRGCAVAVQRPPERCAEHASHLQSTCIRHRARNKRRQHRHKLGFLVERGCIVDYSTSFEHQLPDLLHPWKISLCLSYSHVIGRSINSINRRALLGVLHRQWEPSRKTPENRL